MTVIGIVPARMAAARFPGKPLARLCGQPMIEHVYRRAAHASRLDRVYVATPDREVRDAAVAFGAAVVMTSPAHTRALDRVAEAAQHLHADIVVAIQGDEPLLDPAAVDLLCDVMLGDEGLSCANLVNHITNDDDFNNPNQIKVVCDQRSNILYMSRRAIPATMNGREPRFRQLGIIAFRNEFLATFAALPQAPLEAAESIDMLRALEHGYVVRAVESLHESFGVDTVEDLHVAEERLKRDPLRAELFRR